MARVYRDPSGRFSPPDGAESSDPRRDDAESGLRYVGGVTPAEALRLLMEGNERFVSGTSLHRNLPADVRATSTGQRPFAAIVACMDSRVPVSLVFDLTVGDVFAVRVAGNVVGTNVLGSLEFATAIAGAKLILVLGHTQCGAIKGAIDRVQLGTLTALLARISPAVSAAGPGTSTDAGYVRRVSEENVRLTMRQIRERSSIVRDLLASGGVRLVGSMYDLETGRVTFDEEDG
jgi:carbonic anhydrase